MKSRSVTDMTASFRVARSRFKRHLYGAGVAIMMGISIAVAAVTPAQAHGTEGCTAAPGGIVCVHVWSTRTRVREFEISRIKGSWDLVCHYGAQMEARFPDGTRVWIEPRKSRSSCAVGRGWFNWKSLNYDFPRGTRLCGYFWESGNQQGGAPCVRLF